MKKYLSTIKSYLTLDKISWVILFIALILNLILWYIWIYRINFNKITMFYCLAVLLANAVLSFWVYKKETIMSYFLLGTALLIQIFVLVLIYNTV